MKLKLMCKKTAYIEDFSSPALPRRRHWQDSLRARLNNQPGQPDFIIIIFLAQERAGGCQ
ncbi:MAG: hypothetical protein BWY14_00155 [Parcubacteria group bacterium ADurb.Bin192]|nr:MAG: hypothetical protein BWY14_00155 [Parcubacteria group bacterium ADurb.Bin192]